MESQQPALTDAVWSSGALAMELGNSGNPEGAPPAATLSFAPQRPANLAESGLLPGDLTPLILKYLFLHGSRTGNRVARQIKFPFGLVVPMLEVLKSEMLVVHKGAGGVHDYEYELTPKGVEQARLHLSRSTYCGSAPVSLDAYQQSVIRQSIKNQSPTFADVAAAFSGLEITELMVSQIGQAISSGKSLFLFGKPGNGKTTLAKRAIRAMDRYIWIPRAITIGGEIIRIYDPSVHTAAPLPESEGITDDSDMDDRWVRIQRPTIVVGGELELRHLEATLNPITGIIEAPVHVKSNGGCLVVDDLGRQLISSTELLNRWIVPMESGSDFLNLPSGRQVSLPFDQFLIFSTNLEPGALCDEAFLRRIPYKIEVFDPTENQFRRLFISELKRHGFEPDAGTLDQLIETHFNRAGRAFRFCHPLDLVLQCRDFCEFHRQPRRFTRDIAELAVLNYFSGTAQ